MQQQQQKQPIALNVGDTLVLRLEGNPTTGYIFAAVGHPKCVKDMGQTATPRTTLIGSPSNIEWRWQAVRGCSIPMPIRLQYGRPWDASTWLNYDVYVTVGNAKTLPHEIQYQVPSGTALVNAKSS